MIRRPVKGQLALVFDDLLNRIMSKREDAMDFSVDRRGRVMVRPISYVQPHNPIENYAVHAWVPNFGWTGKKLPNTYGRWAVFHRSEGWSEFRG